MKNLKIKWLLLSIILSIASINTAWGKLILIDMSSAPNWYDKAHIHYYSGSDKYVAIESTGISNIYKATIPDSHGNGWRLCRYDNGRYNDCPWISDSGSDAKKYTYNASSASTIIGLIEGGKIYFDNSKTKWTGTIQFVIGHSSYSRTYTMTKKAGTELCYLDFDSETYHQWSDATYYAVISTNSKVSDGSWGISSLPSKAPSYRTATYAGPYSLDANSQYLITTSSGAATGSTITITYKSAYTALNYTQTVTLCTKAYGASSYTANTSSLTSLNFTTYNLTGVGTVSTQQTNNMNGSTGVASGSACHAATTTINVGDAPASWVYDGIFTSMTGSGSAISTDQEYSYYPSAATNYYVRFHEVHDPSVSLAASSSYLTTTSGARALTGEAITLTATATYTAGSPVRYTYEYSTNGGSTWNSIASNVTDASKTYTPTTTGDYKFRVTLPNETGTPSAITNVHVTQMYTIKIKKNDSWTPNKLYIWNKSTEITQYGAFPGETGHFTTRGQWYEFELNSDFDSFIISASAHGTNHTADVNNVSSDGCYSIGGTTGTSCPVSSATCPSAPTVTTGDVTASSSTSVTFPATVTSYGNDKTTYGVAYYKVAAEPTAATIYSSGTKAQISNNVTADNTTASTSAQTITAGNNYWYVAYALNGQSSSAVQYGSVKFLRTTAVTLNRHGATDGSSSVVALGGKAMPSATMPSKTGYTFGGYWTGEEGTGTKYYAANGTSANNWPTNEGASKTLHAQWTANKYDVTLKLNTGSGTDNQVVQATYGSNMPLVLKTSGSAISIPTKTGYTLLGYWDTSSSSGGNQYYSYSNSTLSSSQTWNKTSATNLHARWQANQYTLTLKKYNGQSDASETATYDATISVTDPTKTGYTFTGYWTNSSGGTKIIDTDGHFVNNVTGWTSTTGKKWQRISGETLHAQWTANTYTIAFDANDDNYVGTATGSMSSIADATYDVSYTLPANAFSRTGYTFAGWATSPTGAVAYSDGATGVSNLTDEDGGTATLYAKWTGITYTVWFNANGGSNLSKSSTEVAFGSAYGTGTGLSGAMPTVDAPSGSVFKGWYDAPSGGRLITQDSVVIIASNHTLYAQYTQRDRVYFYNNLGWEDVYVTYDASYWDNDLGTGNYGKIYHHMTRIGTTNVWYDDIPDAVLSDWKYFIAFNSVELLADGKHAPQESGNYGNFDAGQVVYRHDFDLRATMFVPKSGDSWKKNNNKCTYQSSSWTYDAAEGTHGENYRQTVGYWMRYHDTQSGYAITGTWDGWANTTKLQTENAGDGTYIATKTLAANTTYHFLVYKDYAANTFNHIFTYTAATITSSSCTDKTLTTNGTKYSTLESNHIQITTTTAGEYVFKLTPGTDGVLKLSVEYPFALYDYRVTYTWNDGSAHSHSSEIIKAAAGTSETISVFVHKAANVTSQSLKIEKCTAISGAGAPTWTAGNTIALPSASITKNGVYNFIITQPASGNPTGVFWNKYTGNYYIRTESSDGGWNYYKDYADNIMTYSDYSLKQTLSDPYSHYYCRYIENTGMDVTYQIATDYSSCVSDVLTDDATLGTGKTTLPAPANVRFSWNDSTNALRRAYLKSAQGLENTRYLVLHGADNKIRNNDATGTEIAADGSRSLAANELLFTDIGNWVYEVELKAYPGAKVSLNAYYNGADRYLVGGASSWETIVSGTGSGLYSIKAVYDFKTNRLMTAWIPSGYLTESIEDVDILLLRYAQNAGAAITFGGSYKVGAKEVIGAIEMRYNDLFGKVATWNSTSRPLLKFFVSFPFDVYVGDIFGLNSAYGDAYVIEKYDGAERAEKGFFRGDGTTTFWKELQLTDTMKANIGYCVILDNDYFNGREVGSIWENKGSGSKVYLYFPSANHNIGDIQSTSKTISIPAHTCNHNRTFTTTSGGYGSREVNHMNTDSHWNMMGVPIFDNHSDNGTAEQPGAVFATSGQDGDGNFNYFYEWSSSNNQFSIHTARNYQFKCMHGYMVQYHGDVTFKTAAAPASVAARRSVEKKNYEIELQVLSGDELLNRAYVELRENACDTFALNEDVYMSFNNKAVNVYTLAGSYDVAANVLSVGSHTVPVCVEVTKAGHYTFSMPSNFSGEVTLIDAFNNERTNLALDDYEVDLAKGVIEDRFLMEININNAVTAIDGVEDGGSLKDGKAHKFLQDGIMYIKHNDRIYDANGILVK